MLQYRRSCCITGKVFLFSLSLCQKRPFPACGILHSGIKSEMEGDGMRKYFFSEKLTEGILYRKSGKLTVCVHGGILEAGFHGPNVPRKISWQGLPCLVQTSPAFPGCKVEALCIEAPERKKKRWICVNQALLKDAIGFFLEHGQLEELGDCGLPVRRNACLLNMKADFLTDSIFLNIKIARAGTDAVLGRNIRRCSTITDSQIIEYISILSTPEHVHLRAVLLLIRQHWLDRAVPEAVSRRRTYESLKTGIGFGMSFWTADIEMDAAGIRLFRCREETGVLLQRYGPRMEML